MAIRAASDIADADLEVVTPADVFDWELLSNGNIKAVSAEDAHRNEVCAVIDNLQHQKGQSSDEARTNKNVDAAADGSDEDGLHSVKQSRLQWVRYKSNSNFWWYANEELWFYEETGSKEVPVCK